MNEDVVEGADEDNDSVDVCADKEDDGKEEDGSEDIGREGLFREGIREDEDSRIRVNGEYDALCIGKVEDGIGDIAWREGDGGGSKNPGNGDMGEEVSGINDVDDEKHDGDVDGNPDVGEDVVGDDKVAADDVGADSVGIDIVDDAEEAMARGLGQLICLPHLMSRSTCDHACR